MNLVVLNHSKSVSFQSVAAETIIGSVSSSFVAINGVLEYLDTHFLPTYFDEQYASVEEFLADIYKYADTTLSEVYNRFVTHAAKELSEEDLFAIFLDHFKFGR